jgi:peptide/nickel transport system substrate-binding protein
VDGPPTSADDHVPASDAASWTDALATPPAQRSRSGFAAYLFADIRGYTALTAARGAEAAARVADTFTEITSEVVATHGGTVDGTWGDEVLAVFGSARRAVRAAAEMQERYLAATLDSPHRPLPVGIGLDAGEPADSAAAGGSSGGAGGALNRASRLCDVAAPGEVLATREMAHLAGVVDGVAFVDRGRLHLKGLPPTAVVAIRSVDRDREQERRFRELIARPSATRARNRRRALVAGGLVAVLLIAAGVWWVRREPAKPPAIPAQTVGLIDPRSGTLLASAPVGASPEAVLATGSDVWVADTGADSVSRIDRRTRAVVQTIQNVGSAPVALAAAAGFIWVVDNLSSDVAQIDPRTNQVVAHVPVGAQPSAATVGGGYLWVADEGDATVTRIDPRHPSSRRTAPVGGAPDGVAYVGGQVWVADRTADAVSVLDARTMQLVTQSIPVGAGPRGIITVPGGGLWVANALDQTVSHIDPATFRVDRLARVGDYPTTLAMAGGQLWVSDAGDATLARIDPSSGAVTERLSVGSAPHGLASTSDGLWVAAQAYPSVGHRGGTLVVADMRDIESVDPAVAYFSTSVAALHDVYDGLVALQRADTLFGYELVPDLALTLPTPTNRGRRYRFTLRSGIRYSDGTLVQPTDFLRVFRRELTLKTAAYSFYYSGIQGADTCHPGGSCHLAIKADNGARTLTFNLVAADPDFLYKLTLPAAAAQAAGRGRPGTGPYTISQYVPNHTLVLSRNPHFHQWSSAAQPDGYPNEIRWLAPQSDVAEISAAEQGTADVVPVTRDEATPIELTTYRSQLRTEGGSGTSYLILNTSVPPFDQLAARQAVSLAIDRRIFSHILNSGGAIACTLVPAAYPGSVASKTPCPAQPDVAAARALVKQSGTEGRHVNVYFAAYGNFPKLGHYVAHVMHDIGYDAHLHIEPNYDWPTYDPVKRPMDIEGQWWFPDYPAAANFYEPLLSCRMFAPGKNTNLDGSQFCDRHIERIANRALAAQTTDPAAAVQLWSEVNRMVTTELPVVPTNVDTSSTLLSARVGNYRSTPIFGIDMDQLWVR